IDLFDATVLAQEIAAEEVDPVATDHRFCFGFGQVCPFGTPGAEHGNAVAEIVTDHAPGATLFLAEVGTTTDYLAAIDWFAANGVQVVNHSASGPFDGAGDGTGAAAAVVDYAASKGMLWVNSAGNAANTGEYPNYSGGYWRQTWSDPDADRWLNFSGADESLGSYCGALFGLRWSDWGAAKTDYDLYISDYNINTGSSGSSAKVLAGGSNQSIGAPPLEGTTLPWLCNTNPAWGPVYDKNGDGFVNLWVFRHKRTTASPTGDVLEIAVNSGWLEYSVAHHSASLPFADSKSPAMLAVGAALTVDGGLRGFSSQGPTNDGRMKPDITAVGCQGTMVWGEATGGVCSEVSGFEGTSASAPAVAGIAAAIRSAVGNPNATSLARYLREHASQTYGGPPNNQTGYGAVTVPFSALPAATPTVYHPLAAPTRVLDTRAATLKGVPTAGARAADSVVRLNGDAIGLTNVHPSALVLSVTIVNATRPGFLQVFSWPRSAIGAFSHLNADVAGATRANMVVVPYDAAEELAVYTQGGGHLIVDLVGYFRPDFEAARGSRFSDLDPMRVYDTRICLDCTGAPRPASSFTDVAVADLWDVDSPSNGVPAAEYIESVMIAVTIESTGPTGGFMSVVPSTVTTTPTTSNLNFSGGQTLTSTAIVRVDNTTGNTARIYLSQPGHITVDVLGYFALSSQADPRGMFVAGVPTRLLDSRLTSASQLPAGAVTAVPVAGVGGVPASEVRSVVVNLTSTRTLGPGPVQASSSAATPPGHHTNLSATTGGTAIAATTVTRIESGAFSLRNASATHLIADVAGYFTE
ncbi:MAG: S8 family serine peptidase, partial [Ilumatobacteraceae bacterium]